MKFLLDTNICIYLMKENIEALRQRLLQENISDVGISSISIAELEFGACGSNNPTRAKKTLETFITPFTRVDFDAQSATHYGTIRHSLKRQGKPIGPLDLLIAAQAISRGLILITNNEGEFKRVPGLKLDNWIK
jgi:tRNA(fMet)-specific endonuclease VapC